ncbi:uncharacterized protein LOC108631347 [Ceratina calcarata]|uniref:Uncharacterized protein LOC108631347 n=1 Tax=Ceratina calcarata TaxID=156304 RepID=A0AAJ7JD65_9HYME|nr:uncharacterized protein LOC108631347 [Ceratina calcarata]
MARIDDCVLENSNIKTSANELLAFQGELKEEKELIKKMLAKIDARIHELQVEQLHLLGLINKLLKKGESPLHESTSNSQEASIIKTLDLSVPSTYVFQEEMEDEDED